MHLAYVLDEVLAGHPRFAVVVEINLRLVAPTWKAETARFLPMSRRISSSGQIAPVAVPSAGLGTFHPTCTRLREAPRCCT